MHTCEQKKHKDHNGCVSEVEQSARESRDCEFGHEVMDTVAKEVNGCEATGQEGPPPPVVILNNTNTHTHSNYNLPISVLHNTHTITITSHQYTT